MAEQVIISLALLKIDLMWLFTRELCVASADDQTTHMGWNLAPWHHNCLYSAGVFWGSS